MDFETIGVIFGFICVYLTVKENIWCWPFGIINEILFFYTFLESKIYGQMILQVFFLIVTIYGWINWSKKKNNSILGISYVSKANIYYSTLTVLFLTVLQGYIIHLFTKENYSYLDSFVTSLSFIAQYWLAEKKLESWLVWILVDILSIGMFFYKDLYKVGFFYCALLILATKGFIEWRKTILEKRNIA